MYIYSICMYTIFIYIIPHTFSSKYRQVLAMYLLRANDVRNSGPGFVLKYIIIHNWSLTYIQDIDITGFLFRKHLRQDSSFYPFIRTYTSGYFRVFFWHYFFSNLILFHLTRVTRPTRSAGLRPRRVPIVPFRAILSFSYFDSKLSFQC